MKSSDHIGIIGGGIIGISTAFYLSGLGHDNITIFEQCGIACHSSGKAGGFLARKWCDETDLRGLARASYALHMELKSEFPDLDYRCVDTFQVNTSERRSDKSDTQTPIKWVAEDHVTATKLLDTSDHTAKVSPKLLCNKLISVAKSRGVKVSISKVVDVKKSDGHVTHLLLSNDSEYVPVDILIVAAGPWTTKFIHQHFPEYQLPAPRAQTRAHSVVLRPRSSVGTECLFQYHTTTSGTVDPEIYPVADGTVYVCGEVDYVELPDNPLDIKPDSAKCDDLISQAGYAANCLSEAEVVTKQACYLPGSHDDLPIIGRVPESRNVWMATGHTFWGILNGPATGKCLAELILFGKSKTCDVAPFSPDRFL
ncbi:hypothetical protein ACHWQZ_G009925 [Mnemiopsis leidyi]